VRRTSASGLSRRTLRRTTPARIAPRATAVERSWWPCAGNATARPHLSSAESQIVVVESVHLFSQVARARSVRNDRCLAERPPQSCLATGSIPRPARAISNTIRYGASDSRPRPFICREPGPVPVRCLSLHQRIWREEVGSSDLWFARGRHRPRAISRAQGGRAVNIASQVVENGNLARASPFSSGAGRSHRAKTVSPNPMPTAPSAATSL